MRIKRKKLKITGIPIKSRLRLLILKRFQYVKEPSKLKATLIDVLLAMYHTQYEMRRRIYLKSQRRCSLFYMLQDNVKAILICPNLGIRSRIKLEFCKTLNVMKYYNITYNIFISDTNDKLAYLVPLLTFIIFRTCKPLK